MTSMNPYQIELVRRHPADPHDQPYYRPADSNSAYEYIHYSQFCQLIDTLPASGELQLQGTGDPLFHLHFAQMVEYAVARGLRVSAFSGLTVLPEYCAEQCVRSGLHTLSVALDAAHAATYQLIHGKPRFDRILRNLRRLMKARSQAATGLPHVELACTIMRKNLSELPKLVQLAFDEGIPHITVQCLNKKVMAAENRFPPLYDYAAEEDLAREDPERIQLYLDLAGSRARQLGIGLNFKQQSWQQTVQNRSHPSAPAVPGVKPEMRYVEKMPRSIPVASAILLKQESLVSPLSDLHDPVLPSPLLPSSISAANTEICQSGSARSGTY